MSFAKLSCSRPEKRHILIQTIDTGCVHKIAQDDLEGVEDRDFAVPSTFIAHDRARQGACTASPEMGNAPLVALTFSVVM
jgi:hypothetical protein